MVEPDRPQVTAERGECALYSGYLRLRDTHSECLIRIVLPRQQWLRERVYC